MKTIFLPALMLLCALAFTGCSSEDKNPAGQSRDNTSGGHVEYQDHETEGTDNPSGGAISDTVQSQNGNDGVNGPAQGNR